MKERFYLCRKCGNLVGLIHASGAPLFCCGQEMEALTPNTTEAAGEKHLPVVSVTKDSVQVRVGEVPHPMTEAHSIQWIYLESEKGGQRRALHPEEAAEATFCIGEDKPLAAYAYCNLHGLWKTEIK